MDERPAEELKEGLAPEELKDNELNTVVGGLASGASTLSSGDTGSCISQL
jgi:hypothetical protein